MSYVSALIIFRVRCHSETVVVTDRWLSPNLSASDCAMELAIAVVIAKNSDQAVCKHSRETPDDRSAIGKTRNLRSDTNTKIEMQEFMRSVVHEASKCL